jgi:uncharacterized protein YkwD
MKVSNVVFFILLSIYSFGQRNTNVLYSNIFYAGNSNSLVPKYPSNDDNKEQRQKNINKVNLDSINSDFIKCFNEFRREYGLPSLIHDENLTIVATCQLWYISRTNDISHYNTHYGETPMERAKFLGVNDFDYIAEVCLMDQRYMMEYPNYKSVNLEYTRTIFDLYWSSPHHREILQDTKYTRYSFCNHYDKETKKFYNVMIISN